MDRHRQRSQRQRPRHHTHQHDGFNTETLQKNGIVRMKPTSAICETDSKMTGISPRSYQQTQDYGRNHAGWVAKNVGNLQHRAQHHGEEEKIAMRGFLNSTKASRPSLLQAM